MKCTLALLIIGLTAGAAHAQLSARFETPVLRPLGSTLARAVGKSLPVPAASAGITFTFDPATSAFERETDILGQLYLERARPIGRGTLTVSFTNQWVHFDTIDGQELSDLRDVGVPIVDPASGHQFHIPRFDLGLRSYEVTTSLTYGVTDDLEVNLTVPIVHTTLDVNARLVDLTDGHRQTNTVDDSALGVGDIFLRGKYLLLHGVFGELATGLVFRLPAGNPDNFQGTGNFELSPMLYASSRAVEVAPGMRLRGYVNAGLDLVPQDASLGEGRWGVGLDCMLARRVTIAGAFLAREPFSRLVPAGTFDVPRANGTRTAVFGLDTGHPSYYDISIGGRVDLWRDTVFGVANVIVPANRGGIRANVIPLVGIEAVF
ncbi:MAG: hypothetical protein ACREQL_13405 [Candidatus Binatia bacterium]